MLLKCAKTKTKPKKYEGQKKNIRKYGYNKDEEEKSEKTGIKQKKIIIIKE